MTWQTTRQHLLHTASESCYSTNNLLPPMLQKTHVEHVCDDVNFHTHPGLLYFQTASISRWKFGQKTLQQFSCSTTAQHNHVGVSAQLQRDTVWDHSDTSVYWQSWNSVTVNPSNPLFHIVRWSSSTAHDNTGTQQSNLKDIRTMPILFTGSDLHFRL